MSKFARSEPYPDHWQMKGNDEFADVDGILAEIKATLKEV